MIRRSNQPDIKSLIIREVRADDLSVLERLFPHKNPKKHSERLAIQSQNKASYLVAILHGRPVGHVLLLWDGIDVPKVKERFANTPAIEDLSVDHIYKGRGIDEELLMECYARLKQKGVRMVGISLPIDDPQQKVFFHSQLFLDSGISEYSTSWPVLDEVTGETKVISQSCRYFVKHF